MARQVVHDDDVAMMQFGHEDAGYVGEKRIGVHRPVEHPGRDHAGAAQSVREGGGLPVAEGDAGAQSLAASAAPMTAGHVGGRLGFVDEDQPVGVEIELTLEP